jgi:hypothetical protein
VLTYTQVLFRSIKISAALVLLDGLIGIFLRGIIYPIETFGDILLVEAAVLFLLAGIVDFGTSVGFAQFRKSLLLSKQAYSPEKRKESERRAIQLACSGALLLAILILLAAFRI